MPEYKQVTLKDPKTGDYLVPRVYGTLGYQVVDGETLPPFDPALDAKTLEGHPAEYFAQASHTHTTSQVTGLDSEISSLKSSVSNGKSLIASAITDKGISTASDATFQTMANNIGNIATGDSVLFGYASASSAGQRVITINTGKSLPSIKKFMMFLVSRYQIHVMYETGVAFFLYDSSRLSGVHDIIMTLDDPYSCAYTAAGHVLWGTCSINQSGSTITITTPTNYVWWYSDNYGADYMYYVIY